MAKPSFVKSYILSHKKSVVSTLKMLAGEEKCGILGKTMIFGTKGY